MVPNAITGQGGLHPVGALKDPALLNTPEPRLRDILDSEKITKFKFPPLGRTPMDVSLGECYGSGHRRSSWITTIIPGSKLAINWGPVNDTTGA